MSTGEEAEAGGLESAKDKRGKRLNKLNKRAKQKFFIREISLILKFASLNIRASFVAILYVRIFSFLHEGVLKG